MVTKESQKSSPHGVRKSSCGNFTRVVMASMLVLMGGFVASRLYALDISDVLLGTEPTPHGMEMCSHVSGPKGMEDVQIVGGRFAYFSADSREWVHRQHREFIGREESQLGVKEGALYVLDLLDEQAPLRQIQLKGYFNRLFPHGINVFVDPAPTSLSPEITLMVVNHGAVESVDIFRSRLGDDTAEYVESVPSPWEGQLNDIVILNPASFFVSLWIPFPDGSRKTLLSAALGLKLTFVAHCSRNDQYGWSCNKVVDSLMMANGVALSNDKRTLFVADSLAKGVYSYHVDPDHSALTFEKFYKIGYSVDNVNIAEDGSLWIGSHPNIFRFILYLKGKGGPPGSQVFRVWPHKQHVVEEILVAEGSEFSASCSAAALGDSFLVSSVFDAGFLRCKLPDRRSGRVHAFSYVDQL